MENEALKMIHEGKDLVFTFKSEAWEFMQRNNLEGEYQETNLCDNAHYYIKGYKCNLYWIAE